MNRVFLGGGRGRVPSPSFSKRLGLLSGLPMVAITSSNSKIQEGGNLTFACHVTGSPTPKARWRTEGLHSHYSTQVVSNVLNIYLLYLLKQTPPVRRRLHESRHECCKCVCEDHKNLTRASIDMVLRITWVKFQFGVNSPF